MSVVATGIHAANIAVARVGLLLADTANDVEFDETKVTPGPDGFFATAVVGVAVILLGFLLVRRLRRIAIRAEVRERIAEEQTESQGSQAENAGAQAAGGTSEAGEPGNSGNPGTSQSSPSA